MHESDPHEEPEPAIYRTETLAILGALADIQVDVRRILTLLEEEDDGEAEAPDDDT